MRRDRNILVARAEHSIRHRERFTSQCLRAGKISFRPAQFREIVQCNCIVDRHLARDPLQYLHFFAIQGFGGLEPSLHAIERGQVPERQCEIALRRISRRVTPDSNRPAVQLLGFPIPRQMMEMRRKVVAELGSQSSAFRKTQAPQAIVNRLRLGVAGRLIEPGGFPHVRNPVA